MSAFVTKFWPRVSAMSFKACLHALMYLTYTLGGRQSTLWNDCSGPDLGHTPQSVSRVVRLLTCLCFGRRRAAALGTGPVTLKLGVVLLNSGGHQWCRRNRWPRGRTRSLASGGLRLLGVPSGLRAPTAIRALHWNLVVVGRVRDRAKQCRRVPHRHSATLN